VVDYILNRDENGMVRYLYGKDRKYPYVGKTKWESARWMLENDKSRELRMPEEYEGFPLTADGVYFFDGAIEHGAEEDGGPGAAATEETEAVGPVCGPDYCDIPELEDKPKRKRAAKKAKEVVGE
jgi:hypothetical protein